MLSDRNQRMTELVAEPAPVSIEDRIDRVVEARWRLITTVFWVGAAIALIVQKWHAIHWFSLSDTDDNMRFDQVRDWLAGQGWYDLRQHRLDPPIGFSIHWSRLVDLPLAGLILILNPLLGAPLGYRWACAIAPMLPMLLAFWMMAIVIRRLVSANSYPLALAILLCGGDALAMWTPLRIDHHGWQLALLMMTVAGLTEPNMRRSGVMIAISSALSLAIGLEMLPYVAFAGAAVALHWAWDRAETERMRVYGATMAVATTLCFLVFASNDNWLAVCDALSPVWLTTVGGASLLLTAISFAPSDNRWVRLALVVGAGAIAGGLYVGLFPQCFGHRLEGLPPEAEKLWLSHVSEARPGYLHPISTIIPMAALPIAGTIGSIVAVWRRRGTRAGADWLPRHAVRDARDRADAVADPDRPERADARGAGRHLHRALGLHAAARKRLGAGARDRPGGGLPRRLGAGRLDAARARCRRAIPISSSATSGRSRPAGRRLPQPAKTTPGGKPKPDLTKLANRRCPTIPALAPIGRLPAATFFTFIDSGPRADHADASQRGRRSLSSQRAGDSRHRACLPRHARSGACDHRGAPCANICWSARTCPEATIYQSRGAGGLLRQAGERLHPGVAGGGNRCRRIRRTSSGRWWGSADAVRTLRARTKGIGCEQARFRRTTP